MENDEDEIGRILCDFEMAEYICCLLDYLYGMLTGRPVCPEDARFFLNEEYYPDHPVMATVQELRNYDYRSV